MLNLTTNRILQHLQDDNSLAIVSPFRTENSVQENNKLLRELKAKVRSMNLGFSELKSKWVEIDPSTNEQISSDERALMIYGISLAKAMELGTQYKQSSIIYKDAAKCAEICTMPFIDASKKKHSIGKVVRTFNVKSKTPLNLDDAKEIFAGRLSGPASKAVKSNRPFTLKEVCIVELPKGSMFSNGEERYVDLLEFDVSDSILS